MRSLVLLLVPACVGPRTAADDDRQPDGGAASEVGCVAQVATSIGQDSGHTCAVTNDGAVSCWGRDHRGQVGDGQFITTGAPFGVPSPVRVMSLATASSVSLGERHSCALLRDHSMWCWGWDQDDQLGGAVLPSASAQPLEVVQWSSDFTSTSPLTGAMQLAAGGWASSMIDGAGTAWSWGANYGAWSDANCTTSSCQAFQLPCGALRTVATGIFYGCAITTDDRVECWGQNTYDRIGAAVAATPTPIEIALPAAASAISIGFGHTCAVLTDGSAWCWGWNEFGQLGNAAVTATASATPVQVAIDNVAEISVGGAHTCAVKHDGSAWCWGFDSAGQLGNGTTTRSPQPIPTQVVALGTHVSAIRAGDLMTCAIDDTHHLWCWGDNTFGQLGTGSFAPSTLPAEVAFACPGII